MSVADERVLQLLQKWQKSLDMHARYTGLTDDQYWLVQPWPSHQRPTRWVIDLARQRLADLQRIVAVRLSEKDPSLAEALELMSFLTNLVGSQNIERFVPVAEVERERPLESLSLAKAGTNRQAAAPSERKSAAGRAARTATGKNKARTAAAAAPDADTLSTEVVKDAARMLNWGRKWHELPEAIASISGRPDIGRVRQILRSQREDVENRASALASRPTD